MSKIIRSLNIITTYSMYALVFIIPFSNAGIEIFGSIGIVAWVVKKVLLWLKDKTFQKYAYKYNFIFFALGVFIFINFLSCLFSFSFSHSIKALFTKTIEYALFFLIVVDMFSEQKRLKILISVLLASFSLMCLDAAIQYYAGFDLIRKYPLHLDYMITASFLHHNDFGNYLITYIPLLFGLAAGKKYFFKYRFMFFILFLAAFIALIFSYVRASWIAFLISMSFFTFALNKKIFACFLAILLITSFFMPQKVESRVKEINSMETLYSEYRIGLWQEAIKMIKERPFLGWGINTYTLVAPNFKVHPRGGIYSHNSYLQMAAEIGVIGLGTFLLFLFRIFAKARSSFKKTKDEFYKIILLSLVSGIIAYLVNAFFDTSLYALKIVTIFWITAGILVAVCNISEEELESDSAG
ncbi:MAG: O-antigen ligase family protein [Candidatus Omnitrophota bacterium]